MMPWIKDALAPSWITGVARAQDPVKMGNFNSGSIKVAHFTEDLIRMIEVWKYWWQLLGIMPSDEMQKLRAENELLKVQLDMLRQREYMIQQSNDFIGRVKKLNEEAAKGWNVPTNWTDGTNWKK
jgi:hypothetical protein